MNKKKKHSPRKGRKNPDKIRKQLMTSNEDCT